MACLPVRTNQDVGHATQPATLTYTPSSPPAVPSQPQTWAEYLKRLARRDTSVGISRTWVKKGRTGSHGEIAVGTGGGEIGRDGEGGSSNTPHTQAHQMPNQVTIASPPPTESVNPKRLESFYLPTDRVPHFAAMMGGVERQRGAV